MYRLARSWDRFWFHPADPSTLGLIRLLAGLLVFYVHVAYSYDLQILMGENAVLSLEKANEQRQYSRFTAPPSSWTEQRERYQGRGQFPLKEDSRGIPRWSIWFHVTEPTAMVAVHCGILVAMFLFAIGCWTRVTSVLTWLGALAYIQRTPITFYGADAIMMAMLFYLMIGPSGEAFSVDRLLARWLARRKAIKGGLALPADAGPEPMISANFALRLLQLHFCLIYFAAGTSKLLGSPWWNGTAIYMTMANYEFAPLPYAYYLDNLRFLCQNRWLWEIVIGASTYGTLALELTFPFLVWNRRLRPLYVVGAVLLHTGIAIVMGLAVFSLLMAVMVLAFVPGDLVKRVMARVSRTRTSSEEEARSAEVTMEPAQV